METGETRNDVVLLQSLAKFGNGYIDFLEGVAWSVTCAQTRGSVDPRLLTAGPDPEDVRKVAEAATNLAWFRIFDVGNTYTDPIHPFFTTDFTNTHLKGEGDVLRQESDEERTRDFAYARAKFPEVVEAAAQKLHRFVTDLLEEQTLDEKQRIQLVCGGFLSMANNYFDFETLDGSKSKGRNETREFFYNTIITSALSKYSSMQ